MTTPQEIYHRLGVPAVLIPIKGGTKASSVRAWSKLQFKDTQKTAYQNRLLGAPAIAVCLGDQSKGLCSIDIDDDLALKEFIRLNPGLETSLVTSGKRGCNIWIKLSGDYPGTKKLKRNGEPIGEWRSSGGYTIICGAHPDGIDYRIIVDASPATITFPEIVWPEGWNSPGGGSSSFSPYLSEISQDSITSLPSLYQGTQSLKERDSIAKAARKNLKKDRLLSRLYDRYVARSFTPKQGSRNETLIALVTFLFHAVGRSRLIELVTAYHQTNYDIFLDSLDQHMSEALSHLEVLESEFLQQFSRRGLEFVHQLPTQHLETFRICRDLANFAQEESPAGEFYISFNELANRISTSPSQAGRVIEALISLGTFEVITKGELYQKGRQAKATRYRWLLE